MKLTTSNVVTGNISVSSLNIGNTSLSTEIQSLSIGNVAFTSNSVNVGNVSITPLAISTPSLAVGGVPYSGGTWGSIVNYQEFTANGTWFNPYANAFANAALTGNEQVFVMMWGGGGGAAGNNTLIYPGGGGVCLIGQYALASLTNTCAVTVGSGGTGAKTTTSNVPVGVPGGNSIFVANSSSSMVAVGGSASNGGSAAGLSFGSGILSYGNSTSAGSPLGGNSTSVNSTYGGTSIGVGVNAGTTIFGGGGAGGAGSSASVGGSSIFGGSGAGWTPGTSVFGGIGGFANLTQTAIQASAPGGGGGANSSVAASGARGEVRVWVMGTAGTTLGAPTYTITGNTSLIAGGSETYTITTTNVPNGTSVYYTLNNSSQAVSTDFTSATNGSVIINGGVGTFTLTANSDADTANETFYMDARIGGTSGTIVANSQTITILPPASITLTDTERSGSSLTTYTFTNQNLGTASSDRQIIVTVGGMNNQRDISSVTVAGVTATQIGQIQSDGGGTAASTSGIYMAAVPTGTTGTVVVTFSGSQAGCIIGVYAARNLKSTTPLSVVTVGPDALVTSASATLTTKVGGFVIATVATKENGATGWTWTNATENYDLFLRQPENDRATAGATATTSSNGSVTVTATATTGGSYQVTFVAASFQ